MKQRKQKGFVFIFVIVVIILVGIHMFVLAGTANTMQFQSHTAYLRACERNLLASGLAWARQNIPDRADDIADKTVKLDVSRMDIRGSELDVTIDAQSDGKAHVQVSSLCTRGRQTLKGTAEWTRP